MLFSKSTFKRFTLVLFLLPTFLVSQSKADQDSPMEKAHKTTFDYDEFHVTKNGLFKLKLFAVEDIVLNEEQHWFFQVLDHENNYVNYAYVKMNGYLIENPEIEFDFIRPVYQLCTLGKYMLGYVKLKKMGTYQLDFKIDNFGTQDTIRIKFPIE